VTPEEINDCPERVRNYIRHLEDLLGKVWDVVDAADVLAKVFRSEIEQAKGAELVAQVLNDFYRQRKALPAREKPDGN